VQGIVEERRMSNMTPQPTRTARKVAIGHEFAGEKGDRRGGLRVRHG
jgi:hypothetical protein